MDLSSMDFPLITTGPPPIPFRERVESLPQIYPEASSLGWAAKGQPGFIKNVTPIDLTPYDVDLQDNRDQIQPLSNSRQWMDFSLKNAMGLYFKVAEETRREKPTVDLYA